MAPDCPWLPSLSGWGQSLLFVNESRLGLFDTHRVSRHHVLDLEYAGFSPRGGLAAINLGKPP